MEAYRELARAKHEAFVKRQAAFSSDAASPSPSAPVLVQPAGRSQSSVNGIRDQVICACVAINQRCLVCMGRTIAGLAMPSMGITGFAQSLPDASLLLDRLYAVAPPEKAHELSAQDKAVFGHARNLIYGEIEFFAYARIIEIALQSANIASPVFVDLGSGTGKAVVAAALLYSFADCVGVELLPSLHAVADAAVTATLAIPPHVEAPPRSRLHVVCGDLFEQGNLLPTADVVYVATTGFDDALLRRLADFLAAGLRPGAITITLSLPLPHARFHVIHSAPYRFSWGNCTVYISQFE